MKKKEYVCNIIWLYLEQNEKGVLERKEGKNIET